MNRCPSASMWPMSPVCSQPSSSIVLFVAASLFEVALHHLRAADPHLAVLVDAERRLRQRDRRSSTSVFGDGDADRAGLEHARRRERGSTGDSSVMP